MFSGSTHKGIKKTGVLLALAAACIVVLAFGSGCERKSGPRLEDRAPETGIFLEGPVDTTRYSVKLFWWGQDSDGEVTGFYYRWTSEDPASVVDTNWVFTTARSGEFILPVPDGFALQTFWVKAVDNAGIEDPTPAREDFPVRNSMPSVAFVAGTLPDTTLPAATFSWVGTDPDGDNTVAYYVVWLDGMEEEPPIIVAGRDTTLGPDYIKSKVPQFWGNRTVYVRAVDEAQGASPVISYTWYVIQPVGDVLLVDDVPSTVAGAPATDTFFRSLLDSLTVTTGGYTLFDLGNTSRVRSPREVGLILPLFEKVVWYGDTRTTASGALVYGVQGGGIASYLNGGGNIFLEGVALLGDAGSLPASFAAQYLGVDSLRTRYISAVIPKSTNFTLLTGWVLRGNGSLGLDSLQVGAILGGCEMVYPSSQAEPLYYVPPGNFAEQTENYYVGTLVRGGVYRSVCLTFPIRRCNVLANARQETAKLLKLLDIGP